MRYFKNILKFFVIKTIKSLLWILDKDHRNKEEISSDDIKKFTHITDQNFQSDFGRVSQAFRTVPYQVWELKTNTKILLAADRHIIIKEDMDCVWLEELNIGDKIQTDSGIEEVISCKNLNIRTHMYCVNVNTKDKNDNFNHLYYTDGILSHNTTCAAGYLLWRAMFTEDFTILITANKQTQAYEIINIIKYAYENMEDFNWLRAGVKVYNNGNITFDNGSRIIGRATTPDAGRGMAVSLLYCLAGDTMVTVRDKETFEEKDISLADLYSDLYSDLIEENDDIALFFNPDQNIISQLEQP